MKILGLYVMALLYVAAGVNHFINPGFYTGVIPPYLPWPLALVYLSGVAEVGLGILLIPKKIRPWAAWGIVAMLLIFYVVHVHMLLNAEESGLPLWALWGRMVLQVLLIWWAWCYTRAADRTPEMQPEKQT